MQNQNPSEDDSTKKSPSSPSDDTSHPTNNNNNPQGESLVMKTVWQVLEELGGSGDDSDGDSGFGDGAPVAVAVGGGGDDNGDGDGSVGGGATVAMEKSDDDSDNNGDNSGSNLAVAVVVGGGDGSGSSGVGATVTVSVAVSGGGGNHGGGSSGGGGGGPVAVSVAVGGGSTVVESVVVSTEGVQGRKRKTSIVRDPPTGRPTCPLCQKEFPTWKGAFGHMRAHPDRDYRGFFKPPVFGSPSSTQDQPPRDDKVAGDDSAKKSSGEVNNGEKGSASSHVRVPMFDLNEPIEEEGSSHAAEPAEDMSSEEGKGFGFDLNEMPPAED
eukprot:XP_014617994.1 protein argonaute 2-like [Glycine max]